MLHSAEDADGFHIPSHSDLDGAADFHVPFRRSGYDAPRPSQNETPPRERSGGTLGADDNFSIACLFREHRAAVAARVVAEDPQTFRGEMCTICWQPIVAEGLGRERGHVYECCRQGVHLGCLRDLQDYGFDRCPYCRARIVFPAGLEGMLREGRAHSGRGGLYSRSRCSVGSGARASSLLPTCEWAS